jgi:uncharacterized secreted protein with C-terminal beta-propeller domain
MVKMARNSMFGMAGIGIAAAIGFVFALGSLGNNLPRDPASELGGPGIFENGTLPTPFALAATQELKKFTSAEELRVFLLGLEQNRGQIKGLLGEETRFGGGNLEVTITDGDFTAAPAPQSSQGAPLSDAGDDPTRTTSGSSHSTTNVQVEGVDEPDFLKNDGKYVYILSGDRLTIVDAYPPENADIAVKIALDIQQGQYLQNMFLNNNTLVIFYQEYGNDFVIQEYDFAPQQVYSPKTHALIMDVSDREKPEIVKDFEVSGNYNNARMIGDNVYLITASDLYDYGHPVMPSVMESSRLIIAPEVYYFDNPELYYAFNTVTSIDLANADDDDALESKSFMMNPGATLYVSENNIYIAYQKNMPYYYYYETNTRDRFFDVIVPELPQSVQREIKEIEGDSSLSPSEKWDKVSELLQDTYNRMSEGEKSALFSRIQESLQEYDARIQQETQKTVIHKIEISSNGSINYESRGEVPGRLLNQFSMDEDGNRFRVATTSEYWTPSGGSVLHNNVYVLDEGMKIVGELEEIAKGESIYSARFMGDRLYLVTFERIDPFFVIDLSEDDPKVLGELKLPGYSNYLHPYDSDHVIGIGKETKENQYGGVDILGVKLALFDVSDVQKPGLVDEFEIGGSGTDSEVLYDHKALLFDRSKDVLSIPVSIVPDYAEPMYTDGKYIQPKVWRGFYVFGVDPDSGFKLKGQVEHFNDVNDYYYGYGVQGSRSFYIEDVLYTVTLNNLIKMNDLSDMDEIGQLKIGTTGEIIPYPSPLEEGGATESSPPSQQ